MTVRSFLARIRGHDDRTTGIWMLFRTLIRIHFLLMLRYRLNFVAQILGMYLFFVILFFGGQAVVQQIDGGAAAMGSTLDGIIIGWFLWTMAQSAYFSLSGEITAESRWGTLEQLYISSYGFGTIMTTKVVVNMLISLLIGFVMLVSMILTTGRSLSVDLLTVVPISVLTLLTVVGLGFVFAGLTLIYKKIESVSQLMQFPLIALIAAPISGYSLLHLLPLTHGSAMLQESMRNDVKLWEFALQDLGILVGTAIAYSVAGYVVFQYCSRVARKRGVMGHY